MTTEPWPCWTCKWRGEKDATGTYSCIRPTNFAALSIWERWTIKGSHQMWRALGTEKQLRGESDNDRPECPVMEAA